MTAKNVSPTENEKLCFLTLSNKLFNSLYKIVHVQLLCRFDHLSAQNILVRQLSTWIAGHKHNSDQDENKISAVSKHREFMQR